MILVGINVEGWVGEGRETTERGMARTVMDKDHSQASRIDSIQGERRGEVSLRRGLD
jgi:hypothetical protein